MCSFLGKKELRSEAEGEGVGITKRLITKKNV